MKDQFLNYVKDKMQVKHMPNEDMRMLAECAGVEAAISVMTSMAGGRFLVPLCWQKTIAEEFILKNAGIMTVKELAVCTEISEAMIYKILNTKRNNAMQTTLLDQIGG